MTPPFWKAFLDIFHCRTSKQLTFLESWDKTGQDRHIFKSKFWFLKIDLLTWIWPDLWSKLKTIVTIEFCVQMARKICVTRRSRHIFIRWPHLIWTWPALSISSVLTSIWHLRHPSSRWYLRRHPSSSTLVELGFEAASGLVSAADKARRVSFDLWPELGPTSDL